MLYFSANFFIFTNSADCPYKLTTKIALVLDEIADSILLGSILKLDISGFLNTIISIKYKLSIELSKKKFCY